MPRRVMFTALLVSLAGLSLLQGAEPTKVTALRLADADGRLHTTADWPQHKAIVIVFLGVECPISNGYAPELARLAEHAKSHGALFLGVHGDPDVSAEQARKHASEYSLKFPILLDPEHELAQQCGARTMPEAVVLRASGEVVYRGRIDDRYASVGRQRVAPQRRDLQLAIDAVVAGKLPEIAETKAIGCPLPRLAAVEK